jgi:membrane-bound ClpP family serine protease
MRKYWGMTLILVGVIFLSISYFTWLSHFNAVLILGLVVVVLGLFLHVWTLKRDEKY